MSHSHEDRVAQHDPRQCAAYGCPMPGSMSASTTGTSEWHCWLHFGASPGRWQRITADLNRVQWLAHAIVKLRRDHGGKREQWAETYRDATQAMRANQRGDLVRTKDETLPQWFARLDGALRACCGIADEPAGAPRQQTLMSELQASGTFAKVAFEAPA